MRLTTVARGGSHNEGDRVRKLPLGDRLEELAVRLRVLVHELLRKGAVVAGTVNQVRKDHPPHLDLERARGPLEVSPCDCVLVIFLASSVPVSLRLTGVKKNQRPKACSRGVVRRRTLAALTSARICCVVSRLAARRAPSRPRAAVASHCVSFGCQAPMAHGCCFTPPLEGGAPGPEHREPSASARKANRCGSTRPRNSAGRQHQKLLKEADITHASLSSHMRSAICAELPPWPTTGELPVHGDGKAVP